MAEKPANEKPAGKLPEYAGELAAFHRAFAGELKAIVAALPLAPTMRVLDVGCGDGFYAGLLAQRLISPGGVVGLDINPAFLEVARRDAGVKAARCDVEFAAGELADLPQYRGRCDLVWCAQSLYSLPEPVAALKQMAAALEPSGIVALLENDTLHEVLLPWPGNLEIALRSAELAALQKESDRPSKYYVGRRLKSVLAAAGFEPLAFRTQSIDRQAPLDADLETFLQLHLARLAERVSPHLEAPLRRELEGLIDPARPTYMPRDPHFTMSWINILAWGRLKPG